MITRLILLAILAVLIVAVLIIALVPLMEVSYYEKEPYVVVESYLRTETYTEEFPIDYELIDTEISNLWWRPSSDCSVTIKNTGLDSGYFRVEFNLTTQEGKDVTKVAWQYLDVGEQREVIVRHEEDYVKAFAYTVTPPIKVIINTRQVPDTREVTKFRDVERTEKVTVLEYLRKWR
jgi:hypothetical protein